MNVVLGDHGALAPALGPVPARVVIVNDASVARGGATGLAILSAEMLAARGIPVTFVAGDDGQGERLRQLGVEVVAVGGRGLVMETAIKALHRGIYNLQARRVLSEWIRVRDTPGTVYHLHGWSKILSPSILDALANVASRTVIHAHDFFLACPNGAFMDYHHDEICLRRPLGVSCIATHCDKRSYPQKLWRVTRQTVLNSRFSGPDWARVVVIHERMTEYLTKSGLPASLISTLRNPTASLTRERVAVEDNRDFLFIGRVEAEKGVVEAIEAAARSGTRLRVVGDGPLRQVLADAHPEVEFLGWRSREELGHLLRDARAVVMPTRYPEPFGLVAAEAARSGVPVILARSAFLSEDFARFDIGLSCDTRDPRQFADAMAEIETMPRERIRSMSERARIKAALISTTPEEWVDGLLEYYAASLSD